MSYTADSVTMQVVRYGLEAIADDMGYNLMRMGRTTIVKEIMDINCAVLDASGGILAQAHLCPLMLFSLPTTAANLLKHVKTLKREMSSSVTIPTWADSTCWICSSFPLSSFGASESGLWPTSPISSTWVGLSREGSPEG